MTTGYVLVVFAAVIVLMIVLISKFKVNAAMGILIAAIFPTGCLLFLVAFLLIGCGCCCMRR